MTSKAYTQKGYLAPPADDLKDATIVYPKNQKRRRATIYDAVAGRVTNRGSTLLAHSITSKPLSAQHLLFQRVGAPTLYAEKAEEYNFASKLPSGVLPESDLLKGIHTYASDYYGRTYDPRKGKIKRRKKAVEGQEARNERLRSCRDFRSMDETALLAIGVLMEEMMKSSIGETGDLAFTVEGAQKIRNLRRGIKQPVSVVLDGEHEGVDNEGEAGNAGRAQAEKEERKRRRKSRKSESRTKSKKGKT